MPLRASVAALVFGVTSLVSAMAQPRVAPAVIVEEVSPKAFSQRIEALGTLEPKEIANLTLNAADRVTGVYFEDGQRVKEGQTLVALVQREQRAQVEAAEAELREASSRLDRLAGLVEYDAGSIADEEAARRDVETSRAQLRQVQSQVRDRILVAPFDGLLGFRQVSVGSYVQPGDVVTTLIDDSVVRLDFGVPATRLFAVQRGTQISAETDSLPGEVFRGEITSLNNAIDPETRSVRVRATLPNDRRLLKAGMFMRVVVDADPRQALSVPEQAIQPVGPRSFVFVVDPDGVARRQEITIGARYNGLVEVTDGLTDGQRVITEGVIRARDGQPVRVIDSILRGPAEGTGASNSAGSVGAGQGL